LWHGDQDNTLATPDFYEEIDEWTDVLGCPRAAADSQVDVPKAKFIRTRYKDKDGAVQVEAVLEVGYGHGTVMFPDSTIKFFGLDKPAASSLGAAAVPGSLQAFAAPGAMRFRAFASPGSLALDILSADGARKAALAGRPGTAGAVEFAWNGTGAGGAAPAGVYFAVLRRDGRPVQSLRFALTR
jgi:hypothetical protein